MTETTAQEAEDLSSVTLTDALLSVMAISLAIFITSANSMTIAAIWRTESLRTLANTYVCSLAVADMVVGLVCFLMALFFLPPVRRDVFYKHIEMCSLFQGISIGMVGVSALHMTLIAVDRYLYIIKPYFYERVINIRVIAFFIGLIWIIGLTLAFLPQFITKPYGPIPVCDVTERLPFWYLCYTCSTLYVMSCTIDIVMYTIILRAAGKQRRAVVAHAPKTGQLVGETDKSKPTTNINKGTMESIKFFLTVFGVFFVCVTPTIVLMGVDFIAEVPDMVYHFINLLTLMNSGMNFFIFAMMNEPFKKAFLNTSTLSRCFKK